MKPNRKGFTLIELLIVIVIIGILVAVTIAVINPEKQRNRAKDAGVQATINKIALSVGGYASAYGSYPDCADFFAGIDGKTNTTGVAGDFTCTFKMSAVDGSASSIWTYVADNAAAIPNFVLTHEAYGLAGKDYVYTSTESGILYTCPTGETDVTATGCEKLSVK